MPNLQMGPRRRALGYGREITMVGRTLLILLVALLLVGGGCTSTATAPAGSPSPSATTAPAGATGQSPTAALIHGSGDVNVMYAATLVGTFERHVGPAFSQLTGFKFLGEGKGSIAIANLIKDKTRQPDIFVSADTTVNNTLQGPANGDYVSWWVPFATTELVIAWSPKSRLAPAFVAAKAGQRTWESALLEPGMRFGRTDPEIDPKGYRTVFMFELDQQLTGDRTLSQKILGEPVNLPQLFLEEQLVARLQAGELDAGAFYEVEAIEAGLPYLTVPKEIHQGDISLADYYATATYTNRNGTKYVGSPIVYTVTIPSTVRNRQGALAFAQYLLTEPGQVELSAQGLVKAQPKLAGDASALPVELRVLVQN